MEVDVLGFIVAKIRKIEVYERAPRTDEEFTYFRKRLLGKLKKAKKNYKMTHEKKYLREITNIKIRLEYLVSNTEYNVCKKIIEDYKASYIDILAEELWNYDILCYIYAIASLNNCITVEQALELKKI